MQSNNRLINDLLGKYYGRMTLYSGKEVETYLGKFVAHLKGRRCLGAQKINTLRILKMLR